jgi:hypothetical protein
MIIMLPTPTPTSTSTSNSQNNADSVPPPYPKITRGHSCVLCQQRKVRCDRQKPCSNCIKARAECVPSAPTLPRRRRRKLTEIDMVGRLRRYEHLLRSHGVKIDDDDSPGEETSGWTAGNRDARLSMNVPRARNQPPGALFADKENSHYVERYGDDSSFSDFPLLTSIARFGRISGMRYRTPKMPSTAEGHLKMSSTNNPATAPRLSSYSCPLVQRPRISALCIHQPYRSFGSGKRFLSMSIRWSRCSMRRRCSKQFLMRVGTLRISHDIPRP